MSAAAIPASPFAQHQHHALLSSLPPELVFEIISCVLEPSSSSTTTNNAFISRIKTLTNLSLTTPSLRSLILSSPTFWSNIEINIIQDVSCSPPLSFLRELFERSKDVKMKVRIVHWGEERRFSYENDNMDKKGWEWVPGAMREVRKVLERHNERIESLRLEFYDLNGTEYVLRPTAGDQSRRQQCQWRELRHLELYAADWGVVNSLPMGWVEMILKTASPENFVVQGNGAFGWAGNVSGRLRRVRVETEISERLAVEMLSRAVVLEECVLSRMIQPLVNASSAQRALGPYSERSGGVILLPKLKKLHVGSPRGSIATVLNAVTAPRLQELRIEFVERNRTRWDQEAFRRFVERSGLEYRLKVFAVRAGRVSEVDWRGRQGLFVEMT